MSLPWLTRLKGASYNEVRGRRAFSIERLEEILLFSAAPANGSAVDWRQETFTLDNIDQQASPGDFSGGMVTAQSSPAMDLVGAMNARQFGLTGAGYSVAIIDTGIDYNNAAFAGRYLGGWDFVNNDADPMDDNGHGTHVAGIIGSANSSYPGVASGIGIISLKVLDASGSGNFGNVDAALQWVAAHQAQYHIVAVNMSLGSGNYTVNPFSFLDADLQTLTNENVFVAAASGNSYFSYGSQPGLAFPAISNNVVSVGAVWDGSFGAASWANGAKDYSTAPDQIASFTQRGAALDILAPGAYVTSTYLNNSFASMAGTSMASPMVAAAAALIHQALDLKGQGSLATESNILSIMKATGVSIVDGAYGQDNVNHTWLTFKRLDVYAALESILGANFTPPPNQSPPPAPATNPNEAFVASLYQEVLGRNVDPGGMVSWVHALQAGMSRLQLVDVLWSSAEHRAMQIVQDYQTFLQRAPGAEEVNHWVGVFLAGASETDVANAFLHSSEYLYSNPSNAGFVQRLFRDVLGRSADPAGLATLTSFLDSGQISRVQLADFVLHSNEHDTNVIGQYYQQFLGREASMPEKQAWATLVEHRYLTFQNVAEAFLASDEFYRRAGSAGNSAIMGLSLNDMSLNPPGGDTSNNGYLPFTPDFESHARAFDGWDTGEGLGNLEVPLREDHIPLPIHGPIEYPWTNPSGSIALKIGSSQVAEGPAQPEGAQPQGAKPAPKAEKESEREDHQAGLFDMEGLDAQDEADLALLAEIESLHLRVEELVME